LTEFGLAPSEFGDLEEHEKIYMRHAVAERMERESDEMPDDI